MDLVCTICHAAYYSAARLQVGSPCPKTKCPGTLERPAKLRPAAVRRPRRP
jgi:hypothetical protein